MKKVGIRDVAAHAGVSTATVSHVLNKTRFVSPETIERVMNSVKELNYSPNEMARSFKTGKKNLIGCIVPDISNEYWSAIIKNISSCIDQHGYRLVIANTKEDAEVELDHITVLSHGVVDGIIVASTMEKYSSIKKNIPNDFPIITIDRTVNSNPFSSVTVSNYNSVYQGVMALLNRGHKKIAYFKGFSRFSTTKERISAYKDALKDYGINYDESIVYEILSLNDFANLHMKSLIHAGCTAAVASNSVMTTDILLYLFENNLIPGKDFCLLGYDEGRQNNFATKYMSYITQPISSIGYCAGEQIMELIDNPVSNIRQTIFEASFTSQFK